MLLVALVVGANACSLALDRQRPSGDGGDASRDGDIVDAPRDAPADRSVDGPPGDGLPDADLASDRGLDLDGPDAQPPDLGPCGGGCAAGLECVSGACVCTTNSCGGCCEGNTCIALAAQTPARCGRNGQNCGACSAPSNPCRQASCTAAGRVDGVLLAVHDVLSARTATEIVEQEFGLPVFGVSGAATRSPLSTSELIRLSTRMVYDVPALSHPGIALDVEGYLSQPQRCCDRSRIGVA